MSAAFWSPFAGFVAGFLTAVFAEPLRQWLWRPALNMEFKKANHFLTKTPARIQSVEYEALYVRVKVINRGSHIAKSCRPYLVAIDRLGPSGTWDPTDYCESLQLAWSARGDERFTPLDLPKDVPHFIDVLSTNSLDHNLVPEIVVVPFRYEQLFTAPGEYRFTVLVAGDGVKPASMSIAVKWTGQWDKVEAAAV
jgi:hypothetical protein